MRCDNLLVFLSNSAPIAQRLRLASCDRVCDTMDGFRRDLLRMFGNHAGLAIGLLAIRGNTGCRAVKWDDLIPQTIDLIGWFSRSCSTVEFRSLKRRARWRAGYN
ncbi:unnamed protein product, partial [Mycena citricolor]